MSISRKNKHLFLITLLFTVNVTFFQNCSNPGLSFEVAESNSITEEIIQETNEKLINEDLGIERVESKQLDIVWVIDNSGSMSQEAAHVRQNYQSFIDLLKSKSLIKSALISQDSGTTGVQLPEGLDPEMHIQISKSINSYTSMCVAQSSMFTSSEISERAPGVCNQSGQVSLTDFYRQTSKKIFVFVTDDEEGYTNSETFVNIFKQKFEQDPIVYSFVGLGSQTSPCQARTGNKYMQASELTGGQVFNICETDWEGHYSKLIDHVSESIKNTFSLQHSVIERLVEVKIDDVVLSESDYVLQNGLLTINPDLILGTSARVKIQYVVVD